MKPWEMMRRFTPAAAPGGGGSIDPYWSNVVALLHFDGSDGSTDFPDATGRTWGVIGFPEIDTAQSKFGGGSLTFPPGLRAAVSTAASSDFDLSGNFTVEGWLRPAAGNFVFWQFSVDTSSYYDRFLVVRESSALRVYFNASGDHDMTAVGTLADDTWYHIAIARSGSTAYIFIDGIVVATISMSAWVATTTTPVLGYPPPEVTTGYQARGHLDEWRFTKGVARYTANFTPPAAPYPDS